MTEAISFLPRPLPTKLRPHEQTLHLTHAFAEFSQRNATGNFSVFCREQKTAVGRRVITGKPGQLLLEVLKAEIDFQPGLVFAEEITCFVDVGGSCCLLNLHAALLQNRER